MSIRSTSFASLYPERRLIWQERSLLSWSLSLAKEGLPVIEFKLVYDKLTYALEGRRFLVFSLAFLKTAGGYLFKCFWLGIVNLALPCGKIA